MATVRPTRGRMQGLPPTAEDLAEAEGKRQAKADRKAAAEAERQARIEEKAGGDATVAMLLDTFPGCEIVSIRDQSVGEVRGWRLDEMPPTERDGWTPAGSCGNWTEVAGCKKAYQRYAAHWMRGHKRVDPLTFDRFGDCLNRNGWAWYPQTRPKNGDRVPAGHDGRYRDPKAPPRPDDGVVRPRFLAVEAAPVTVTRDWFTTLERQRKPCNAALAIGGAASQYTWALDCDANDPRVCAALRTLAAEHLPRTPYVRYRDESPRWVMLYRMDPADPLDRIPGLSFKPYVDQHDDKKKGGDLEVLASSGKSVTVHGRHYHSERPFLWEDLAPGIDLGATPERAPLVSSETVRAFLVAARAALADDLAPEQPRAARVAAGVLTGGTTVDTSGLRVPAGDGTLLTTGRPTYLWHLVIQVAWLRPNIGASAEQLTQLVVDAIPKLIDIEGWKGVNGEDSLRELVAEKMGRVVARRDDLLAQRDPRAVVVEVVTTADGVEIAPASVDYDAPDYASHADIAALTADNPVSVGRRFDVLATPADPAKAEARALKADRSEDLALVAATVKGTAKEFLEAVAMARGLVPAPHDPLRARRAASAEADADAARLLAEGDHEGAQAARALAREQAAGVVSPRQRARDHVAAVHLLRAPVGSGKTTACLQAVIDLKRTLAADKKVFGPLLFHAPSHALLGDVAGRAEGMTASEPEAEAVDLDEVADEASRMGVVAVAYKGKSHWCDHPAFKRLHEARMSTANLCKSKRRVQDPMTREWREEESFCSRYVDKTCGFWAQRRAIPGADMVLMPTAYITLPLPEEVREHVVARVVDESMAGQVLATARMPVAALTWNRPEPTLSQRDILAGLSSADLMEDRRVVAADAKRAVDRDADVALALFDAAVAAGGTAVADLLGRVASAINVDGRAMDVHADVHPRLTDKGAGEVVASKSGITAAGEEKRFWRLVEERLQALVADRTTAELLRGKPNAEARMQAARQAKGARDYRLQVLRHDPANAVVRLSWRRKISLPDLPTLLMDASADTEITRKLWKGREVVVHEAPAPLNLRTILVCDRSQSNTSLLPYRNDDPLAAAANLVDVRRAFDALSTLYGTSRVGGIVPKSVEIAMQTGWVRPANVDLLHLGHCVGVNTMVDHPAILCVGRNEPPIDAIDATVAALTYDDDQPEKPVDPLGTMIDAKGNPVQAIVTTRSISRRDGSDVHVPDRTYPGAWAKRVQRQAREEGIMQGIGRVRPVYSATKTCVYMGHSLPDGVTVDWVLDVNALVESAAGRLGEDLRHCGLLRYPIAGDALMFSRPLPTQADQRMAQGTHPAQRGLARIAWTTAAGATLDGLVPAFDIADPEALARRVARYSQVSRIAAADDPVIRVLSSPEVDTRPTVPTEDPKVAAILGPMADRHAAEAAGVAMAKAVAKRAGLLHREAPLSGRAEELPELRQDHRGLRNLAAALTVRDPAGARVNLPEAPWVGVDALPEFAGRALVEVLAEAARTVEDEQVLGCAEPPAPVDPVEAREALLDEAAALLAA